MNIDKYMARIMDTRADEKPLDNIVDDGGLTGIFRNIVVVGDSLASGEFQSFNKEQNVPKFHDMFWYSWGQYMVRAAGVNVQNFSRGGMTAKFYLETFGNSFGRFDVANAAQAYIMALGVNDVLNQKMPIGCADDMWDGIFEHESTFAGYYNALIEKYEKIQPDAKFFLLTMPKRDVEYVENDTLRREYRELIIEMAKRRKNAYVIDLYEYMPAHDESFRKLFYLDGHMNPMGYMLMGKVIMSYIDYIIRHNYEDFIQVPFIGLDIHNHNYKW